MYDLIYANGDSYTAGAGLAQELYWDMEPLSGFDVTDQIRIESDNRKMRCKDDWQNLERQRSYPSSLANLANLDIINNSQSGAGLGQIAFTAIQDLTSLSKQHDRILAVIGLTSPKRIFYPKSPSNTLLFNNITNTSYLKTDKAVLQKYAETFTTSQLELYGIMHLVSLIQICDWLHNVDMVLIETPAYKVKDADPNNQYKVLKNNIGPKIIDSLVPNYNKKQKIHLTCNHVIKQYHDDLAKRIYKRLWKN